VTRPVTYVVGEDEGEVELVRDSLGVSTREAGGSNSSTAEGEHLNSKPGVVNESVESLDGVSREG